MPLPEPPLPPPPPIDWAKIRVVVMLLDDDRAGIGGDDGTAGTAHVAAGAIADDAAA